MVTQAKQLAVVSAHSAASPPGMIDRTQPISKLVATGMPDSGHGVYFTYHNLIGGYSEDAFAMVSSAHEIFGVSTCKRDVRKGGLWPSVALGS